MYPTCKDPSLPISGTGAAARNPCSAPAGNPHDTTAPKVVQDEHGAGGVALGSLVMRSLQTLLFVCLVIGYCVWGGGRGGGGGALHCIAMRCVALRCACDLVLTLTYAVASLLTSVWVVVLFVFVSTCGPEGVRLCLVDPTPPCPPCDQGSQGYMDAGNPNPQPHDTEETPHPVDRALRQTRTTSHGPDLLLLALTDRSYKQGNILG